VTHVVVRRVALGLSAVCVSAATLFAWIANRSVPPAPGVQAASPAPTAGARLFEAQCAGCHPIEQLRETLGRAPDRQIRRREVEVFLAAHGTTTADEDRAIVEYLMR
jgi:mono/diheme cytochrome c family protein